MLMVSLQPLYRGFGDIQARLVTAQQYVRVTPGFNNDQAQNIQSLLTGVGQDLTHFATTIIQEHTKSQHQAGELRVQYEKAQNELLSRRQQITELQEQYRELAQEKDFEAKAVASFQKQIESHQSEIKRLQKLTRDIDQKHMKQVKVCTTRTFPPL
jgi:chromosome segregation ATPase